MNRINIFNKYPPLTGFYIPSYWFVLKNSMFDVDPSAFKTITSEDELVLIKDHFFGEDLFISRTEYHLSSRDNIVAVVSVGCRLFDDRDLSEIPTCFYDVDFYLNKSGKGQQTLYQVASIVTNRFDAIKKASLYMKVFFHYVTPAISNGELNVKSNFQEYVSSLGIL